MKIFSLKNLLSTNLLKEDPDVVKFLDANDTMTGVSWADIGTEPRAFVAFDDYSFISSKKTHGAIYNFVDALKENVFDKNLTEKDFIDYVEKINGKYSGDLNINNMQRYSTKTLGDIKMVYKDLKSPNSVLNEYIKRKDGRAKDISEVISGRYWKKYKIISFWKKQSEVVFMWDMIEKMLIDDGENPDEYKIDWLERGRDYHSKLTPVSSLKSKTKSKDDELKLSDEDYKKLMSKLHVAPPEEKKIILKQLGVGNLNKASDIANKLNMTVAQYNHLMNINENILKEDPDTVTYYDDDGEMIEIEWYDGDGFTFFTGPKYSLIGESDRSVGLSITHTNLILYIQKVLISDWDKLEIETYLGDHDVFVTNIDEFYKDTKNPKSDIRKIKDVDINDYYVDPRNLIKNFVTGRYWKTDKIISFWNKKAAVMKVWNSIEDMMEYQNIKDFEDYKIDWIERSGKEEKIRMQPVSSVKSSGGSSKVPELSKKEYLELLKKAHVSPPDEKRKILKQLGADNPNKAGAIANKLNMTVAQYNHLMNINENILNETPDVVKSTDNYEIAKYHNPSARAFFIEEDYGFIGTDSGVYHSDILLSLIKFYKQFENLPDKTKSAFMKFIHDNLLYYTGDVRIINPEAFYNDLKNPNSNITQILKEKQLPWNIRNIPGFLSGRMWEPKKILSFWQDEKTVVDKWYYVENLFSELKLKLEDFDVDFMDRAGDSSLPLKPAKTIGTDKEKKTDELSAEAKQKILDILSRLHTAAPEKKKEMLNKIGANTPSKIASLADKLGFNSVAEFYHYAKLDENILKEDPDTVSYKTPDGDVIGLHYMDDDARMFAVFKEFSIIANEGEMIHGMVENLIMDVQEDIDEQPRPLKIEDDTLLEINHRLEEYNLTCTNLEELAKFVIKRLEKATRYIDLRYTAGALAGRLWSDEKVMSFWNSKHDVVKMWPHVVELFKFLNLQIQNYSIDFLERENDEDIKLEPVKNLKAPSAKVEPDKTKFDDDTQTNFIDKLFTVEPKKLKTLSPSQLKKIREKLHLMDPAEKQKFAKKVYSMKNKAAELADALGFNSVAQMNSVMKLDEQVDDKPFAAFVLAKYKSGYAATTRAADRGETGKIGLPGGKLDLNETPVQAAEREAREEGWSIDIVNIDPIQIAQVEGKTVYWYEGVNAKPLNDYKEKNRITPIVASREEILNSGYGNQTLPI